MHILSAGELARDLAVRDLTDPAQGSHALQLLADDAVAALTASWRCRRRLVRSHPIVAVEDCYDRLGFSPAAVTRDRRYTRYVSDTCMLRSHTSAGIPPELRRLASSGYVADLLLVCPGIVYRRDAIDRIHTGTPHQLDLWRISGGSRCGPADLAAMVALVVDTLLPGRVHRTVAARHPYTEHGQQIDVRDGDDWVEIGECGVAAPAVLAAAGLDTDRVTGLAMGLGLDRILMLRKAIPDIRLLRSADPRVSSQMLDLERYRAVSHQPATERDLSIAVDIADTAETLGDDIRAALGARSSAVEAVSVRSETPYAALPQAAVARLGMTSTQKNVLLRVVLRDLDRTLTAEEANALRDRIYAAVHRGGAGEWTATPSASSAGSAMMAGSAYPQGRSR